MAHKPKVKFLGAFTKTNRSQNKKWRRWQQGKENSNNPQNQKEKAGDYKKGTLKSQIHFLSLI